MWPDGQADMTKRRVFTGFAKANKKKTKYPSDGMEGKHKRGEQISLPNYIQTNFVASTLLMTDSALRN
jgi:hypothetical protein